MNYKSLLDRQRHFYHTGRTRNVEFRRRQLRRIYTWITEHEEEIEKALRKDLGKGAFEAYTAETCMVKEELHVMITHLERWSRIRKKPVSPFQFPGKAYQYPEPRGVVLVMSPWNYPFQLSMIPLIAAIAAGNCVVLKPSAYAPHTSHLLRMLADSLFPPEYVAVVEGGREENEGLLEEVFDFIFFTGSVAVGKLVMEKASRHLTPVCLELGGKSPCIVDETADLNEAARRIVWGKFLNAGQTCVAPDYLWVQKSIKEKLLLKIRREIVRRYGEDPLRSPDYPRIVNRKHFDRLCGLMKGEKVLCGGKVDTRTLRIAPTILDEVSWDHPVMKEEIFGPILPVMTFYELDEVIRQLQPQPSPLALYYFCRKKNRIAAILQKVSFGGGCINDTVMHLASVRLPFGGVGNSGMGAYHGKAGFDTFTHYKSILEKPASFDIPARYWKKCLPLLKKSKRKTP